MINVNGTTYIGVSQETADAIIVDAQTKSREHVDNIPGAVAEAVLSSGRPLEEVFELCAEVAPEMLPAESAKIRRRAEKLLHKARDQDVRAFVRREPDDLARKEALDDEVEKVRIRREAQRVVKAEEEDGDRPPLSALTLDWDDLIAQPEPRWLVDDVIPESGTVILYGASGVGKSFVAQSIVASIAGGFGWLGRPARRGKVLYIFAEGGAGAGKRFQALSDAWNKGKPIRDLLVLLAAPNLTHDGDVADLEALNREHDFAAIVFDTLNRVAGDAEENSATAMSGILNAIERIRRAGSHTTSVIVSHAGKNGDLRGSTALWAAADTVLELTGDPKHLKLDARKQKDAAEGIVGHFRLKPSARHETLILEGIATGLDTSSDVSSDRLEETLKHFIQSFGQAGASRPQFVDLLGDLGVAKKSAAFSAITALINSGQLKASQKGRSVWLSLPTVKTFPLNKGEEA